jgi:pSer/pThr/pTyr-binding forkhead associated (FHA) protein
VAEAEQRSGEQAVAVTESAAVKETAIGKAVARLVLIMELGDQGDEYLVGEGIVIGRRTGEVTFPHDDYMSGRHAKIEKQGNRYILSDEGSRNGVFIKIDKEVEIRSGDQILIGKQLFRFET